MSVASQSFLPSATRTAKHLHQSPPPGSPEGKKKPITNIKIKSWCVYAVMQFSVEFRHKQRQQNSNTINDVIQIAINVTTSEPKSETPVTVAWVHMCVSLNWNSSSSGMVFVCGSPRRNSSNTYMTYLCGSSNRNSSNTYMIHLCDSSNRNSLYTDMTYLCDGSKRNRRYSDMTYLCDCSNRKKTLHRHDLPVW